MDTTKQREEFERLLVEWWPQANGNIVRNGDEYENHFMSYAWWGFKAAIASIEIELFAERNAQGETEVEGMCMALGFNECLIKCAEAITAAGLRVKS